MLTHRGLERFAAGLGNYHLHRLPGGYPGPLAYAAKMGREVLAIVTSGGEQLDPTLSDTLPNLGLIACVASGYERIAGEPGIRRMSAIATSSTRTSSMPLDQRHSNHYRSDSDRRDG